MHCPQCGCKMGVLEECPYCKITSEQVFFASNIRAKQFLKNGKSEDVCYTNVKPRDVSKLKMFLLTIFLGFLGVNSFYVGRKYRGIFSCISILGLLCFYYIQYAILQKNVSIFVLDLFVEIFVVLVVIDIILWVLDMLALIFKFYKYPVVIPTQEELKENGRIKIFNK